MSRKSPFLRESAASPEAAPEDPAAVSTPNPEDDDEELTPAEAKRMKLGCMGALVLGIVGAVVGGVHGNGLHERAKQIVAEGTLVEATVVDGWTKGFGRGKDYFIEIEYELDGTTHSATKSVGRPAYNRYVDAGAGSFYVHPSEPGKPVSQSTIQNQAAPSMRWRGYVVGFFGAPFAVLLIALGLYAGYLKVTRFFTPRKTAAA